MLNPFNRRASCRLLFFSALLLGACGPSGVDGNPAVADFPVTGTVFTIVFENHGAGVVEDDMPYLTGLAEQYASADAYYADHHPSLPNYLIMTSGSDHDVDDDGDPADHPLGGGDNLADQLDAAGVPWRAYMEGMGDPCVLGDRGRYAVRHNPFVYYTSLTSDPERCAEHVVDMQAHLAADLESDAYDFMWITPDTCNDMHDCSAGVSDQWLSRIIPQIMASPGYQAGGAIFLMWDEGGPDHTYVFGGKQTIPFVVVSEQLVSPGFVSDVLYTHDSYLASVEDIFGMPRLPTTVDAAPFADFFDAPQE